FMDGINGITAFYALSVLAPLAYLNFSAGEQFFPQSLLYVVGISVWVFSWFNARKRARTFAGDVGSVSMAFILAYLMLQLFLHTGQWAYILFLSVYGVDAVLTIMHRLIKRENIFQAHRSHFYQYLANELAWPHLRVSGLYAILQLLISTLTIWGLQEGWHPAIFIGLLLGLVVLYVVGKRHMLRGLAATG
ncbi:MAG: UDP-GlcNAc--UDP-phosphate GlcNAc-1-phosphate transferase, partial [Schleiferiaceae bacterium]|nr:UDP-GlcNAc--UDP-phosphate GlcNAc-1-phosphate transferase [Schleiferiaceae bacterium]